MSALSPTAVADLRADVIVLSTGDVRLPIHPSRQGLLPRREEQAYQRPAGTAALRATIAERASSAVRVAAEQVLVAPGARLAILSVLSGLLAPGNEVLLPAPYWVSYPALIRMAQGTAVPVPGAVGDGVLSLGALDAARTPATRALVVNSPRNPDGAVIPGDNLTDVLEWAARHSLVVLFDQVYRGVPLDGRTTVSVLDLLPELPEHCVVVDGLSKSHALAGLRIGWAIARADRLQASVAFASHLYGGTCVLAQEMAEAALRDGSVPALVGGQVTANLERAMAMFAGLPEVPCSRPRGGIFLFPDLRRLPQDGLVERLRDDYRVAVADGAPFGAPGHVRLSYAVPSDQLDEGLRRLRAAIVGAGRG